MKVSIACPEAAWAFQAAEQFERLGVLHRLIATRFPFAGQRVDRAHLVVNRLPDLWGTVPRRLHLPWRGDYVRAQAFDWWARRQIAGSDLLIVHPAGGLHTIRAAKAMNIVTVLERDRAHVLDERTLLREESRRFNLPAPPVDDRMITKQVWEYGEADYVSTSSTFVRDSFLAHGFPAERLITVPLGYDARLFSPGAKRDAAFRILAGGAGLRDGTPFLLEAVRGLDRPDVEVVLLGEVEPGMRAALARHPGRIRRPGEVNGPALVELLRQGSVFVQGSVAGGPGVMILQAMAVGLPVVCTAGTAGADVLRDGEEGFIVPARDAAALRDRLRYLYDHPDVRQCMAGAAAARARHFTWDAYGERMVATYRRVLDAPARARSAGRRLDGFYDYLWHISDLWGSNSAWDDRLYSRHFEGALAPGDVVLDIGCGDARSYHARVMETAAELHGIDVSQEAVARAVGKGVRARVHDISSAPLPYPDETFDLITCFEVLEHLLDPKFAVQEMYRTLRPGGRLLVSVPNAGYFRDRLITLARGEVPAGVTDYANPWMAPHIRFFTRGSLEALLAAAGFTVERIRSKGDPSLLDGLEMLGAAGRFLARGIKRAVPPVLQGAFLGDRWPALFADGLLVLARRPAGTSGS